MTKNKTSNLMEYSRDIINKLTRFDKSYEYRVSIHFSPNPLNYDGCDECEIEVVRRRFKWLDKIPFSKILQMENKITGSDTGFGLNECLEQVTKRIDQIIGKND